MGLKEKLEGNRTELMKAKLKATGEERATLDLRLGGVRGVLAAIGKEEVAGKAAKTLSEDEVLAVVRREVKQLEEGAEAFQGGGATERAAEETVKAQHLRTFLPILLDEAATRQLVEGLIAEHGIASQKELGKLMGLLKSNSQVDKGLASKVARELLS